MQKLWVLLSILIWELVFQSQLAHQQVLFDVQEDARTERRGDESNFEGRLIKREDEVFLEKRLKRRRNDSGYIEWFKKRIDDESDFNARLMKRKDQPSTEKKEDNSERLTRKGDEAGLGKKGESHRDNRREKRKRLLSDYSKRYKQGALTHLLQHHTMKHPKWPSGGPKMVHKVVYPGFWAL